MERADLKGFLTFFGRLFSVRTRAHSNRCRGGRPGRGREAGGGGGGARAGAAGGARVGLVVFFARVLGRWGASGHATVTGAIGDRWGSAGDVAEHGGQWASGVDRGAGAMARTCRGLRWWRGNFLGRWGMGA